MLKKLIKFLGYDNKIGDILVDTYLYKKFNKSTNTNIEESHDDINFSLQSTINNPPLPPQLDTTNNPSPSFQLIKIGTLSPHPQATTKATSVTSRLSLFTLRNESVPELNSCRIVNRGRVSD